MPAREDAPCKLCKHPTSSIRLLCAKCLDRAAEELIKQECDRAPEGLITKASLGDLESNSERIKFMGGDVVNGILELEDIGEHEQYKFEAFRLLFEFILAFLKFAWRTRYK